MNFSGRWLLGSCISLKSSCHTFKIRHIPAMDVVFTSPVKYFRVRPTPVNANNGSSQLQLSERAIVRRALRVEVWKCLFPALGPDISDHTNVRITHELLKSQYPCQKFADFAKKVTF